MDLLIEMFGVIRSIFFMRVPVEIVLRSCIRSGLGNLGAPVSNMVISSTGLLYCCCTWKYELSCAVRVGLCSALLDDLRLSELSGFKAILGYVGIRRSTLGAY